MKDKKIQNEIWKKFQLGFEKQYRDGYDIEWSEYADPNYIMTLIKIVSNSKYNFVLINSCTSTLSSLLFNNYPCDQHILDCASICKWQNACELIKDKLPNYTEPIKFMSNRAFFEKLKSTTYDKQQIINLIKEYKKVHSIYLKIKIKFSIRLSDRKSIPFYAAIEEGFSDTILEAFIECDWNLLENNEPYYGRWSITIASENERFKIMRLILTKFISNFKPDYKNDKDFKIHNASGCLTIITQPDNRMYDIPPMPEKIPPFKTFEDRLEFVYYLQYFMEIFQWKPEPGNYANRILQWYKKYQIALFEAIIGKSDDFPRLNKDVISIICSYL